MVRRLANWVVLPAALACAGIFVGSACRIELCRGAGCGGSGAGSLPGESSGGDTSSSTYSAAGDQQGTGATGMADPFAGADPVTVNRESVRASATMYLLQATMEQTIASQGLDPNTLDAATLQQIADDALPDVVAQVDAWLSQDMSLSNDPQVPTQPAECFDMGCPPVLFCESKFYNKTVLCSNTACGDGKCKACPDWFLGLKNVISSGWCSYVCMNGTSVVGSAGLVKSIFGNLQFCLVP